MIQLAKAYDELPTKESNVKAIHLYESAGFVRTGEMVDEETEFELKW